jgi:biotin synthase
MIAVARIVLPKSMIRLSCGRSEMTYPEQLLCFLAGVNSIFIGEKYLTQENGPIEADEELFRLLGLKKQKPFKKRCKNDTLS